jgi:P22 coat protein - gene protein 5
VANNLLTDQHITNEALMILENNLSFTKQVNRQYQKEYKGPAKRGATIFAKKPPRYTVRDSQAVSIQDTVITQVPVTLAHQFGVDVEFYSSDLELNIDAFGRQVLEPQIVAIANAIDYAGLGLALQVSNTVGTPGTTPGSGMTAQQTMQLIAQAQAKLDKSAAPRDKNRAIVVNEDAQASIVPALSGLFQAAGSIAEQYEKGEMGYALGAKWSMSQNVNSYTTGAQGGTPVVSGTITAATSPNGTTLTPTSTTFTTSPASSSSPFSVTTTGWTHSIKVLNKGDVVSFAGCYAVNPVSYQNNGSLKQFVLAADATSDSSGNATLSLAEPMIVSGAFQNCTAVPVSTAPVTVVTSPAATVSPMNLLFHKNAFTFATVDLPLPGGVHMAARKADEQLGISMRFVAAYNVSTDQFIGRFDVLCGWAVLRESWACRIQG